MRIVLLISICITVAIAEPAKSWWGKHSSLQEARDACDKWSLNGGEYYFKKEGYFWTPRQKEWIRNNPDPNPEMIGSYLYPIREMPIELLEEEAVSPKASAGRRWCIQETETRQFLGYEIINLRKGSFYDSYDDAIIKETKVTKNFYY